MNLPQISTQDLQPQGPAFRRTTMTTICSEQNRSTLNANVGSNRLLRSNPLSLVSVQAQRLLSWVKRRREQRENRDAYAQLLKLDDALLQDIGVTRAEVERAARLPLSVDAARVLRESSGRNINNRI